MGGREKKTGNMSSPGSFWVHFLSCYTLSCCAGFTGSLEYTGLDQIIKMDRVCLGSNVRTGVRIP